MTDEVERPTKADADETRANRFQIHIARGLAIGIGGLVLIAVVSVLALGLWSARQNTVDLLADKSDATMRAVLGRVDQYLEPAEHMLAHLGQQMERGAIDTTDEAAVGAHLSGALAATPQMRSAVFIRADQRMVFALRQEDGVALQVLDVSGMEVIVNAVQAARERRVLYWAELIRPETADTTIVNVRRAVHRDGEYLGVLAATVRVDRLSELIDADARGLGGTAFILVGGEHVLAHPTLVGGFPGLTPERPMPSVADIADPVVSALIEPGPESGLRARLERETGIRVVETADADYAVVSSTITRYGDEPWLVAVYFPAADMVDELRRLVWAGIAGVGVLVVSLIAAFGFARYLSAPINRLAQAAQQVSELSLGGVQRLPTSLFTEMTEAASAFNSMVVGLRWFETYVPRKLVHQLVRQGADAVQTSVTREVTVMFTDIEGFTGLSEKLSAPETAAFLNEHFAMLSASVESEGGTIDKFIGDAVMAFWGAPDSQPDHAARGCRAALAIRATIRADNAARAAAGRAPIRVRVGLHSGQVTVGNIGAPGRINYTIVGNTVNTANRLEQLAKEIATGEDDVAILLSAVTVERAGEGFAPRPVGRHRLRGQQDEVAVFAL